MCIALGQIPIWLVFNLIGQE